MELACLDLEGVLIPEIWIEFAQHTGIDALHPVEVLARAIRPA